MPITERVRIALNWGAESAPATLTHQPGEFGKVWPGEAVFDEPALSHPKLNVGQDVVITRDKAHVLTGSISRISEASVHLRIDGPQWN